MNAATELLPAQRVRRLLASPNEVTASDLMGLRAWRDRFPFSGALGVLIAKAAAEADSADKQMELLRAAAHVPSREALFNLLMRPHLLAEAREAVEAIEASELEESMQVEPVETNSGSSISDSEGDDSARVADEAAESRATATHAEGVDREAMLVAIESSLSKDVDDLIAERSIAQEKETVVPQKIPLSPFAKWLEERAQRMGFGASAERPDAAAGANTPAGQSLLIDAFIANNPKIGRLREVGSEVEDLARQSILEDETLVTETMARVFAKQGQLGKARKAYKLLALKYPAKSTYFAAQLKELGKSSSGGKA